VVQFSFFQPQTSNHKPHFSLDIEPGRDILAEKLREGMDGKGGMGNGTGKGSAGRRMRRIMLNVKT